MANLEQKLVKIIVDCDKTSEPIPKKPRLVQNCGSDSNHEEQITSGDESGGSRAVEISPQPENTEAEPCEVQAAEGTPELNNQPVDPEPTQEQSDVEKTLPGPESEAPAGLMDDGVHCNGVFSPELADDEDCSSHASSSDWTPQPRIGSYRFIQQQIMRETDPRTILNDLLPEAAIPPDLDDMTLWQIIINISEPPKRKKRKDVNTIEDVIRLISDCKKILVLTGAGVSVSCGIPDFRSRDGIYARLAVDFPDLPDPQAMFDIEYFQKDPRPFFKFAKEIYPGQFRPSLCHRFIAMLDKQDKLLRNYTQNIDTLEQVAGVQRVMQCHGSFATASCLACKHKVDCDTIREDIFRQVVPHCPRCSSIPLAIMKPDIVFFGENLPEAFHRAMKQDKDEVDLLIVIGSSLKVRPVALIPSAVPHEVPQILINREPLLHLNFDVELLGDCDVIVNELCHRLGGDFEQLCYNSSRLSEITDTPRPQSSTPSEQACAKIQTSNLRNTGSRDETIAETSATVACSSPNSQFPNDGGLNTTFTARDARHSPELKNITTSPKPSTQEDDECSNVHQGPCQKSADACQSEPLEADGHNTNLRKERQGMVEMLNMQSEEKDTDQRNVRKQCWLKRTCRNPISHRLGMSQYLFQVPNRYIFHGAEVYSCSDEETSSSSDTENSCCSESGLEEQESDAEEEGASEDFLRPVEGCVGQTVDESKCIPNFQTNGTMENPDPVTDL